MRALLLTLVVGVALGGCASPAGSVGGGPDRISTEELRALDAEGLTAYQMVQRSRPQWMRTRGPASFSAPSSAALPRVILDGVPLGELSDLEGVPARDVEQMDFLSASDATTRFGTGYGGGAILVRTR